MVQQLDGETTKRNPQKTKKDLFWRYGEGSHPCLNTCEVETCKSCNTDQLNSNQQSQMVCAAKSGVLQEVLANQLKKTNLGEALFLRLF